MASFCFFLLASSKLSQASRWQLPRDIISCKIKRRASLPGQSAARLSVLPSTGAGVVGGQEVEAEASGVVGVAAAENLVRSSAVGGGAGNEAVGPAQDAEAAALGLAEAGLDGALARVGGVGLGEGERAISGDVDWSSSQWLACFCSGWMLTYPAGRQGR